MTNLPKTFKASARFVTATAVAAAAIFALAPGASAATHHRHSTHKHHAHHAKKVARKAAHRTARPATHRAAPAARPAAHPAYAAASLSPVAASQAAGELYVTPTTPAARAAGTATGATRDALLKIAGQSQAQWEAGPWVNVSNARSYTEKLAAGALQTGTVLPLVVYNIPHRDCGQHSKGGAASAADYRAWIDQVAAGIGATKTLVIVEPDALGHLYQAGCLTAAQQAERVQLLHYAVTTLKALPNTAAYLDSGNGSWQAAAVMAKGLTAAGITDADGFALNVGNTDTTAREAAYGQAISALVGGKHFVIDTSRNGNGTLAHVWCNAPGRALGERPTLTPGIPGVAALLWVKTVGNSDGVCHPGDAPAGTFSVSYAVALATAAHW